MRLSMRPGRVYAKSVTWTDAQCKISPTQTTFATASSVPPAGFPPPTCHTKTRNAKSVTGPKPTTNPSEFATTSSTLNPTMCVCAGGAAPATTTTSRVGKRSQRPKSTAAFSASPPPPARSARQQPSASSAPRLTTARSTAYPRVCTGSIALVLSASRSIGGRLGLISTMRIGWG